MNVLPLGTQIDLEFSLPHGPKIHGKGEVRWVRVYSEASNVPPGMGIKFDQLEPAAVRAIEAFLAQREPLFYDED